MPRRPNIYFLQGDGIDRDFITAEIQRYLGPDALIRPGTKTSEHSPYEELGYWITSEQPPSEAMKRDMILDCAEWMAEKTKAYDYAQPLAISPAAQALSRRWGPNVWVSDRSANLEPTQSLHRNQTKLVHSRSVPPGSYDGHLRTTIGSSSSFVSVSHTSPPLSITGVGGRSTTVPNRSLTFGNMTSNEQHEHWEAWDGEPPFSPMRYYESLDQIADSCQWQIGQERFQDGAVVTALQSLGSLGKGSIGVVEEVKALSIQGDGLNFVRKTIDIPSTQQSANVVMRQVRIEVYNLKALIHPHIVKIIGTYQDEVRFTRHFHLLMYPVGEGSLESFFAATAHFGRSKDSQALDRNRERLKKWFGCLTSALAYMHDNRVLHEDIKPKNIIYRGAQIYFTDFSSSRRYDIGESTSTWSPAQATKLFQAPETSLDNDIQKHGSKADVFSLGLVFMEMLAILVAKDISELHQLLSEFDQDFSTKRQYWRVVGHFKDCFTRWQAVGSNAEQMYLLCVKPMLEFDKDARPSANMVHKRFIELHIWGYFRPCPCKLIVTEPADTRGTSQTRISEILSYPTPYNADAWAQRIPRFPTPYSAAK